jgi:hypothetical protein
VRLLPLRRLAACAADGAAGLLLAGLLAPVTGRVCAARVVVMFRIDSPQSLWKGPVPMLLGNVGDLAYGFPLALLLLLAAGALLGASPGEALLRLRVAGAGDGAAGAGRRWLRLLLLAAPLWLWNLALVAAAWQLAAASAGAFALLALGWLPVLAGGRAFHDRLAGTRVVAAGGARTR